MARKKRQPVKCLILLGISSFLLYQSAQEVQTWFDYNETIALAEAEKESLIEQQAELEESITNLNDIEYIIRYARGKYLATKDDGDQVFMLPEEEE